MEKVSSINNLSICLSPSISLCAKRKAMETTGHRRSNSQKNPMTRRSRSRKTAQDCLINTAKVRREIANALHIHRSASSSSTSPSSSRFPRKRCSMRTSTCNHGILKPRITVASSQTIWSTTATANNTEDLEFEWVENGAASYAWWLGFLKSLDGKNTAAAMEESNQLEESIVKDNSKCRELISDEESSFTDDWLTIPPIDEHAELI